jgi:hypothetical protein
LLHAETFDTHPYSSLAALLRLGLGLLQFPQAIHSVHHSLLYRGECNTKFFLSLGCVKLVNRWQGLVGIALGSGIPELRELRTDDVVELLVTVVTSSDEVTLIGSL